MQLGILLEESPLTFPISHAEDNLMNKTNSHCPRWLWRLIGRLRDWLNHVTSDEGCTSADASHLRKINRELADAEHQRSEELCVALADVETLKKRCKLLNQAYRDERARRHKLQQVLADMPNTNRQTTPPESHE